MMHRRAVLAMFGKSAAAYAGWFHSGFTRSLFPEPGASTASAAQAQAASTFEAQLQADMATLSKRVYSEEGIPMILVCEDLTAKTPVVPASKAMNAAVAPAFQHYAEAWQQVHPEARVGDVAKLVELMAYRDFAGGGKDTNL